MEENHHESCQDPRYESALQRHFLGTEMVFLILWSFISSFQPIPQRFINFDH